MLSVILVNYNTFDFTYKCIASIYQKTKACEFEIIVVSNGSVDRSIQELKIDYPLITIIENHQNVGFAKANNIGIKQAKGEYVVLLNSDTELLNDALSLGLECLKRDATIGVVSAQLRYPDGALQHCCQSFPSITAEILETTRLFKLMNPQKAAQKYFNARLDLNKNNYCDWVWGTFFMLRKSDIMRLPGKQLSERFFMYGEDTEWCYQLKLLGLKSYYCADAHVLHHLGKSDFGNFAHKNSVIVKNEVLFLKAYKGSLYALILRLCKSFKFLLQSAKDPYCFQFAKLYAFTS